MYMYKLDQLNIADRLHNHIWKSQEHNISRNAERFHHSRSKSTGWKSKAAIVLEHRILELVKSRMHKKLKKNTHK